METLSITKVALCFQQELSRNFDSISPSIFPCFTMIEAAAAGQILTSGTAHTGLRFRLHFGVPVHGLEHCYHHPPHQNVPTKWVKP